MGLIGTITFANTFTNTSAPGYEDDYADVYISLIDSVTGQSANGNNAVANYQVNTFNSIVNNQVAISGQSLLIYSGVITQKVPDINDAGQQVIFFKTFSVTSVGTPAAPSPPANACDLKINYINIDKSESAPGANDAQITLNASSSYLPLQYSLDDITFQSSATFAGLSGGLNTVYVTDANPIGCTASLQVNIPVLANLLVSDPSVAIGQNTSRWNAAFNPVVFTYQRKDFEVTAVTADSLTGNAILTLNANLTGLLTGDLLYLNAPPYAGIYSVVSTTGNTIIINTPYTAAANGFMNSNRLRPYYQLLTRITYQDKISGKTNTIISTNRPDNTGLVKADISNFLQSLLRAKDESDFTQVNFRDDNLSASYQIAYAQHWDDGTAIGYTSGYSSIPYPYYVIYAAKQLGNQYGGNLAAYVPFKQVAPGAQPADWITDFTEPAYSAGYPFDLGFIYSEYMAGLSLYAQITPLDINRAAMGSITQINLLNEDGSFLLNQDASKLIISNAATTGIPVIEHIGLNRLLINQAFTNNVCYFNVGISCVNNGAPSTFNYACSESADPYVDANLQIKDNGVIKADIYTSDSGTFTMTAGDEFSIEGYATATPIGTDPKLTMTVTKNGTVVFAQTIPGIAGASLFYTGTVDISAVYTINVVTANAAADVTPVNIIDTTIVPGAEIQVIRQQTVRIDKSPDHNSVYLRWIGLTGSWNYYRFIYNQEVTLDVQNAVIIKNYVFDWENQDGIEEVIGKSAGQKIKVMAEDLSVADIKGLQSIKYSPKVQMLINKSPVKWQNIVLNTATFAEYETINGQAPFSVTFNLPGINIQTQ